MKISRSRVLIVTGVILVVSAMGLAGFNLYDDYKSNKEAEEVLQQLEKHIYARKIEKDQTEIEIDGTEYCGILEIPQINLIMPVSLDYSLLQMKESLCRYAGNIEDGNMVICGHNNTAFLGRLDEVYEGERVYYTDTNGIEYEFIITETEYMDGSAVDKMLQGSEEWDMSVFTCNYSGALRYVIRCKRK